MNWAYMLIIQTFVVTLVLNLILYGISKLTAKKE